MNAPAPSVTTLVDALTEQYRCAIAPLLARQANDTSRLPLQVQDLNEQVFLTKPEWLNKNDGSNTYIVILLTGKQVETKDCFMLYYERRAEAYDPERTDPFTVRVFTVSPNHDLRAQQRVDLHPMMGLEVQRQLRLYFDEALHHNTAISGLMYLTILPIDPASIKTKESEDVQ